MAGCANADTESRSAPSGRSAIVAVCTAQMGTAAADRGQERPGDGASPGAGPATDHPGAAGRTARIVVPRRGSRAGPVEPAADATKWARARFAERRPARGQEGWYRGAAAGAPRPFAPATAEGHPDHVRPRRLRARGERARRR